MAITEQTPQHDYTAASGQTEFIFTFTLFDSLDAIKVFVGGVEKVRNTDYNVYTSDGSNILITDFPLTGGKVVFNAGLTAGDLVTLVRDTTISRSTDYNNNSSFDADTFDKSLDKAIAILQDQRRRLDAKIGAPEGDTVADLTLPPQAERASKVLAFDVNGRFIASAGSNIAVTPFMAQVLDDADGSAALGTLGFSTLAKTLIGNSDASTARETLLVPRKNYIIDGGFRVWQAGTSFNTGGYTADMFKYRLPDSGSATVTRGTLSPGEISDNQVLKYYASVARLGDAAWYGQHIEDVQCLAGKTITVSFWAKAASSYSCNVKITHYYGSGGSASSDTTLGQVSLTTTWQRVSVTGNVDSVIGKTIGSDNNLLVFIGQNTVDNVAVDITGWQIEVGNVATEFEYRHIAEEVSLCRRYYETTYQGVAPGTPNQFGNDIYADHTERNIVRYLVEKRRVPTLNVYALVSGDAGFASDAGGNNTGVVTFNRQGTKSFQANAVTSPTGGKWMHFTADARF